MIHVVYVICEPGMDRACVQSTEPSEAQRKRNDEKGGAIYRRDLCLPDVDLVDGVLVVRPAIVE